MHPVFRPVQHKLTVEAYHDLARAGRLGEDDRVELIEGLLIEIHRDPQGPGYLHRSAICPGGDARIAALPGVRIPVAEVFG